MSGCPAMGKREIHGQGFGLWRCLPHGWTCGRCDQAYKTSFHLWDGDIISCRRCDANNDPKMPKMPFIQVNK